MSNFKINLLFAAINQSIGLLIGIYLWQWNIMNLFYNILFLIVIGVLAVLIVYDPVKLNSPHFVVTDMVQCKANICNAVLTMDDIAILIPYDSTKVHVGDTLYLVK